MKEYWQEIRALTMRWVRRLSREKFSMLFTLVQPMLFWLIFFGNLFQRAADMQVTQASSYISFLTAGVVVMTVLNNGLAGGVDLLFDKENGFLERLMSTPIHRTSVILSRFIFVTTITSLQVLVILGVAWLFGVQPVTGIVGGGDDLVHRHDVRCRADGDFHGHGLFSEKPRRFFLGPRVSLPAHDFLELGPGAAGGDAGLDGFSRAV
jgi:ABC-type Na+ efflux pump permease subunit